jgi:phosphoglycolate phosphatase-like HAD superfamily hydrolase
MGVPPCWLRVNHSRPNQNQRARPAELKAYDEAMDVLGFMVAVACGDDASKGKPHPDLFYHELKKLGVPEAQGVLAVGDTPYDALAAKPLGISVVGLLTGGFSSGELKEAGCEAVLAEIGDLEGYLNGRSG